MASPKDIKALKGSIKKWEEIVAGVDDDLGEKTCPLCKLYFDYDSCDGCLISSDTGHGCCEKTPFDAWRNYWNGRMDRAGIFFMPRWVEDTLTEVLAQAELDYLKDLLKRLEK